MADIAQNVMQISTLQWMFPHNYLVDLSSKVWYTNYVVEKEFIMNQSEIRKLLLRSHYHLMDNPRFWYEKGILAASQILCVLASNINTELLQEK
jgi:hypothetical protein